MFRELAELGEFSASPNVQDVPGLDELDPEECNISWDLKVIGDSTLDEVKEIFNWVEGDCELDIQPIATKPKKPAVAKKSRASTCAGIYCHCANA
nr:hypothetical protein [Methylocucumis oryzae]